MNARYGLVLALSLFAIERGLAQTSAPDLVALRRTAILSALADRATREGVALPVGLCSVVRAIGFEATLPAAAPSSIAASFTGDSLSCAARGGAQQDEPWRPFIEVVDARIAPNDSAPQSVSVHLRIWDRPHDLRSETHDFVVSRDTLWTPTAVRHGRLLIHLTQPLDPDVLVLLNGRPVQAHTPAEVFDRVRGQVVDSVVVISAKDSSLAMRFGSRGAQGAIIVGAHPPGTPQCERAFKAAQSDTPRVEDLDLMTGRPCISLAGRLGAHAIRIAQGPAERELRLTALRVLVAGARPDAVVSRRWLASARLGDMLPRGAHNDAAPDNGNPAIRSALSALARSDGDSVVRRASLVLWQALILADADYSPIERDRVRLTASCGDRVRLESTSDVSIPYVVHVEDAAYERTIWLKPATASSPSSIDLGLPAGAVVVVVADREVARLEARPGVCTR